MRSASAHGNDRLYRGPGNDRLSGGPGNDRLSGGPGKNVVHQDRPPRLRLPSPSPPS
ncbi:hypothetical protein [Streptomyces sp. NBC_01775]|uniref:hypothetical protein n=1 Tax=Streptomyces sp. NBC_01775 TaxID=2975939 RepID=UPI002DDAB6CA|nr:hypothetical protein [Streptomyces sp. NBC_01775]